jgi:hypothetical protein
LFTSSFSLPTPFTPPACTALVESVGLLDMFGFVQWHGLMKQSEAERQDRGVGGEVVSS